MHSTSSMGDLKNELTIVDERSALFLCPGETHPISHSVHLARLAAFYPKCRECRHRTSTGQLSAQTLERLECTQHRVERPSLFAAEGVRGVYLNELNRTKAGEIAGALASLLWEKRPLVGRDEGVALPVDDASKPVEDSGTGDRPGNELPAEPGGLPFHQEIDAAGYRPRRSGPVVVVGQDERPSSMDIVTGIAKVLRRMGCHVIDVGLTTRPCFWFAVDHLRAAAGMHVTGSGCDPAWTGLDIVGAGAVPISQDDQLGEIERRMTRGFSRPLRQAAGQRTFHAAALYEGGLWKHFHALRPLRVACGCPSRPVREVIERVFSKLACQLQPENIPRRARDLTDSADPDCVRLSRAVTDGGAHLGILIDDDGQTCALFDERGTLIRARAITRVLADFVLQESRGASIVVEESAAAALRPAIEAAGGRSAACGARLSHMAQALRAREGQLGGGDSGRYWFREAFATCDAVLTIAKVLQALSRSDADFSEVVRRVSLESGL